MKGLIYAAIAAFIIYLILEMKAGSVVATGPAANVLSAVPPPIPDANGVVMVNAGGPNNPGAGPIGVPTPIVTVGGASNATCPTCGGAAVPPGTSPVSSLARVTRSLAAGPRYTAPIIVRQGGAIPVPVESGVSYSHFVGSN